MESIGADCVQDESFYDKYKMSIRYFVAIIIRKFLSLLEICKCTKIQRINYGDEGENILFIKDSYRKLPDDERVSQKPFYQQDPAINPWSTCRTSKE
jgi:hypothetical protein